MFKKEISYSFGEFKEIYERDSHVNFYMKYCMPVTVAFYTASINTSHIYASTMEAEMGGVADELIGLLLVFGRYGCLGMGIKAMVENMLQGANLKEATGQGVEYFIFYILLSVYPKLFKMLKF